MKKMKLKQTGVILDDSHRYWAEGKELHGITGLIKRHVFPDMYEGVPEKILDTKKEYGTMVHEALEVFEELRQLGLLRYNAGRDIEIYDYYLSEVDITGSRMQAQTNCAMRYNLSEKAIQVIVYGFESRLRRV